MNTNIIREFAASFQKSRILLSGIELDIFTNIHESGTTSIQIASHLHLNERACERLLNALEYMEQPYTGCKNREISSSCRN